MKINLNIKTTLLISATIALCMFILYILFGFHYEGVDDPQYKLSASIFNADHIVFFNLFHLNTLNIIKGLYLFNESVSWYDLFMYTLLGIGILQLILYIKLKWALNIVSTTVFTFIACLFLVPDYIVFSNLTRIVIILSSSTILLFSEIIYQKKHSNWLGLIAFLFLLPAFTIRLEAAILSACIALAFILIERRKGIFTKAHLVLFCVVLLSGIIVKFSTVKRNQSEDYKLIAQAEPYVFSLLDMRYLKSPVQLNATNDSIRFDLAMYFYFGDRSVLDLEFLKKITDKSLFNKEKLTRWQFTFYQVKFLLLDIFYRYWPLILIISVFSMLGYISGYSLVKAWGPVVFIIGIVIGLILITYLVKMEEHLMEPLLLVGFIIGVTAVGKEQTVKKPFKIAFAAMLIILSVVNYSYLNDSLKIANEKQSQIKECKTYLLNMEFKHVVFDIFSSQMLFTQPFESFNIRNKKFYVYDSPYVIAQSQFPNTANLSYADFFKELDKLEENVVFISNDNRMNLMNNVLQTFYGGYITYGSERFACQPIVDANFPVNDDLKVFELIEYRE